MGVKSGGPSTEERIQNKGVWEYGKKANILKKIRGKWKELGVNDVSRIPKSTLVAENWSFPLCKVLHLPDTFPCQGQVTSLAAFIWTLSAYVTLWICNKVSQPYKACFQILSWYVKLMSLYSHDQASHKDNQNLLQFVRDC
jgi:hypothetical protein